MDAVLDRGKQAGLQQPGDGQERGQRDSELPQQAGRVYVPEAGRDLPTERFLGLFDRRLGDPDRQQRDDGDDKRCGIDDGERATAEGGVDRRTDDGRQDPRTLTDARQ